MFNTLIKNIYYSTDIVMMKLCQKPKKQEMYQLATSIHNTINSKTMKLHPSEN